MANILVVDDELGIRDLLSEILNDEGHSVDLAENATQARAARANDTLAIASADSQFHAALATGADCELIWQMVQDVKVHSDRCRHLTLQDPTTMATLVEQHRAIVDAIDARDAPAAEAAMQCHLQEILRDLPRVLAAHPDYFE